VVLVLNQPSLATAPHTAGAAPFVFVDADEPQLSVLDLGANRGDGIFESISVGAGLPQALTAHLERFARSAALLELPAPDLVVWRAAVLAAIAELVPAASGESWVKTVMTRGIEGDDRPTGWVYATHSPDFSEARTTGVSVVTLDRGYRHDVAQTSPWLLAGAKTLSYAVNRAAVREAVRRGADDVVFVSSDGIVLEGPTSTVLVLRGNTLSTPEVELGILAGTTQATIFEWAKVNGFETEFVRLSPAELTTADALWLVSSVRLAAPIRELDGVPVAVDVALSARLNAHLRAQTS
jgi:4-amino-4-deoxychorismate lyase